MGYISLVVNFTEARMTKFVDRKICRPRVSEFQQVTRQACGKE